MLNRQGRMRAVVPHARDGADPGAELAELARVFKAEVPPRPIQRCEAWPPETGSEIVKRGGGLRRPSDRVVFEVGQRLPQGYEVGRPGAIVDAILLYGDDLLLIVMAKGSVVLVGDWILIPDGDDMTKRYFDEIESLATDKRLGRVVDGDDDG